MRRGRRSKARGHATVFNGIQFRSRLEARVAALFDILDWDFTYEPDLGLSYYIPDFYLTPFDIICEVKPIARFDSLTVTSAQTKVKDSGYMGEGVMLVGAIPRLDANGRTVFGLLSKGFDPHVMLPFHLTRHEGSWLPCTCAEGCMDTIYARTNQIWAKYQWIEAGNNVQWKSPKKRGK